MEKKKKQEKNSNPPDPQTLESLFPKTKNIKQGGGMVQSFKRKNQEGW